MSRWQLTTEVKNKYITIIEDFINKVESNEDELLELNLSETELNPYTLMKLLEDLGYEKDDMDTNGWQLDFWIQMDRSGYRSLSIEGTGITFELKLCEKE